MLGKDIIDILSTNENIDIFGIDKKANSNFKRRNQIIGDLLNKDFLIESISRINPEVIIHCAAFVNLDFCENNKEITEKLHCETTGQLSAFNSGKSKFIYISTDSVFNGEKGNYNENDLPDPLNFYAQTKLNGEIIALKSNPKTLIIRTNLYGFNRPNGHSLAEWAINNFEKGESVYGFKDFYFNPLYTKQLARIITFFILNIECYGIINVGCEKCISKYEFLRELATVFKYSTDLVIQSNSDRVSFKTRRPQKTCLNVNKFKKTLQDIPTLVAGLNELYDDYIKQII